MILGVFFLASMLAILVAGSTIALPFSLEQRFFNRPTVSGIRGAIASAQFLVLLLSAGLVARTHHDEATVRDAFDDTKIVNVIFYGNRPGQGGEPLTHCKGIFRYVPSDAGPIDVKDFSVWLADRECQGYPTNQWIRTQSRLVAYFTGPDYLMTGFVECGSWHFGERMYHCEVKLLPQETT